MLRLPCPDRSYSESNGTIEAGQSTIAQTWDNPERQQEWFDALREILYIYSQEQSHIGYRQGMHEVASYVWLALDIDRKAYGDGNDSKTVSLLFGKASAYFLLKSILNAIRQAYDVKMASNSRPLDDMARAILSKIKQQYITRGEVDKLTPLLESLSVPPQLYCTKWIRLLFSREVIDSENILKLWHVFIKLVSDGWEWMAVLESAAASRILLCQGDLLRAVNDYSNATQTSNHQAIDSLMNMEPLEEVDTLIQKLKELLELPKYEPHQQISPLSHNVGTNTRSYQQMHKAQSSGMIYPSGSSQTLSSPGQTVPHNGVPMFPNANVIPPGGSDVAGGGPFSLRLVKESLEQGVGKLSSSSHTWRKRLANEWSSLKQHQQQGLPGQRLSGDMSLRPYDSRMDVSLFYRGEDQESGISPQAINNNDTLMGGGHPTQISTGGQPSVASTEPERQQFTAPEVGFYRNADGADPYASLRMQQQTRGHQSPELLAQKLGHSVAAIQNFVMSLDRESAPPHDMMMMVNGYRGNRVPNDVWEALADIEAVRNTLLHQRR